MTVTSLHWLGGAILHALVQLVSNPLLYLGWILYAVAINRQAKNQRQFFGVRLWRLSSTVWRMVVLSLLCGVVISLLSIALGVFIQPIDIWFISGLVVILGLFRLRWTAAPTAIGALVLLSFLAKGWTPPFTGQLLALWTQLSSVPAYALLSLSALLCLVESGLLLTSRRQISEPLLVDSKRGRIVGAMSIQLMFVVPVLVCIPGHFPRPTLLLSWPWLGAWSGSIGLTGLPLFLGLGGMYTSLRPRSVIQSAVWHSLAMSGCLSLTAALSLWFPHYAWIGGLVALCGKETLVWIHKRWENVREPIYVPSPKGVRVLAVVEGSLAESVGVSVGDIITHVNAVPVHTEYDVHFAYSQNPAYVKLQVTDEQGEPRIVGKAVYDGERVKLGVVSMPEGSTYRLNRSRFGILQCLYAGMEPMGGTWNDQAGTPVN